VLPQAAHVPPLHVKPAWHTSPAQQDWAIAPHDDAAAVQVPPLQVVPSQQSALVSQRSPLA
jgi:hypothetical protein